VTDLDANSARQPAPVWTERYSPTGRVQRFFGPIHITGRAWYGLLSFCTRWLPYRVCTVLAIIPALVCCLMLRHVRRALRSNHDVILGATNWWRRELRIFRTLRMFALVMVDRYTLFHHRDRLGIEVVGREHWDRTFESETGCILITAHLGNWEVASLAPTMLGKQMHVVREREIHDGSQALLTKLYDAHEGPNFKVHYAGDDSNLGTNLLLALRRGGVVGLAGDQPRTGQGYMHVELFGRPTPIPLGPFALARAAGVPILPVFGLRTGGVEYSLVVCEPILVNRSRNRQQDIADAAQRFGDVLESMIRQHPHSWYCWWARWPTAETG
jgi:lauroyl/myristoyl acyltransferase